MKVKMVLMIDEGHPDLVCEEWSNEDQDNHSFDLECMTKDLDHI